MRNHALLLAGTVLLFSAAQAGIAQESHGKKAEEKPVKQTIQKPTAEKKPAMKETPLGIIEIELYQNDAPKTVENFVKLTEKKYFNGIIFHRVSKGFVIQGGDPSGNGTGGKSIWGKEFADELNPAAPSYKEGYKRGVVAMANRGPNTNTSQFFIMLRDNTMMPKNYTIFGKVAAGLEVVDRIGEADIIPQMGPTDGKPKFDIVMKTVSIIKMPDGKPHIKMEVVQREPLPPAGK